MSDPLLTVDDVAERLGCSASKVRGYCRGRHPWPHFRIGASIRFGEAHVAEILKLCEAGRCKTVVHDKPLSRHFRRQPAALAREDTRP